MAGPDTNALTLAPARHPAAPRGASPPGVYLLDLTVSTY
jgi:hypothetical protein